MIDRRRLFGVGGAAIGAPLLAGGPAGAAEGKAACAAPAPVWPPGVEGQRRADLGDRTYLNPIVAGDHPDPTILKDGEVYYMTFSSFQSYPGLVIQRSTDLVNWTPVGAGAVDQHRQRLGGGPDQARGALLPLHPGRQGRRGLVDLRHLGG